MKTKDVLERLEKELNVPVNDDTLFFYDRINLVGVRRNKKNNYRVYSEKDYLKVKMAIMLSQLGFDLPTVDRIVNKGVLRDIHNELRVRGQWIRQIRKMLKIR